MANITESFAAAQGRLSKREIASAPQADHNDVKKPARDAGFRQRLPERIPKGFRNKAQGCEGRATLGKGGRCFTTPTGLWPRCTTVAAGLNPFRVVVDREHGPRVAHSSQPWALLRNPLK